MIEQFLTSMISELGATGLLILGFWYITYTGTKKVVEKLEKLNHELENVQVLLTEIGRLLEKR